ncbi:Hypothetical protein, putative [Bodo saltans]|uniref:GRIP domain-containing protein n=1 Tax=Bodo saltans TaxID=75058 RepID=A0A0S4JDP5_BODSA|nr:Hypothetical protein, putative [Bodo saltans]|eukprot:CUG88275.1 Hypothetical protein, putative [Bodo saltans]
MDTPQREATSGSPCAEGTALDIDALRREYESYRLKTKDWQAKVRDRDAKMRQQLQETTDMLVSKDAELEGLSKQISELEIQRSEWRTLKAANSASLEESSRLRDEVSRLNAATADSSALSLALRTSLNEAETEVKQRNDDLKALRLRVGDLEAALADMQWRAMGGHITQTSLADSSPRPFEVRYRTMVCERTYCYVSDSSGREGVWLLEQRLPAHAMLPPLAEDLTTQRCFDAAADATAALREEMLRDASRQLADAKSAADKELSAAVKAERESAQVALTNVRKELEASRMQLQERAAEIEHLCNVEMPAAIATAREEVTSTVTASLKQLQAKVDDLEAYKSRAQVAMRHAAQTATATVDSSKLRDQLELEYAAKHASAAAEFDRRLEVALKQREVEVLASAQADALKEKKQLSSAMKTQEATIQQLEAALESTRQQVRHTAVLEAPVVQLPTAHRAELREGSTQTDAAPSFPAASSPPPPATVSTFDAEVRQTRKEPVPHPQLPTGSTSVSSPVTTFTFESVLQSLETQGQPQQAASSWDVERMRLQLQHQSQQLQRHREELRDVALRERSLLEQSAVLKEQIREMERSSSRSHELREREDYLKNIVVKVLTCSDPTMRKMLMPVVAEILHLSPTERSSLLASCER